MLSHVETQLCLAKMATMLSIMGTMLITLAVAVVMAKHKCRQGPRGAGELWRGMRCCRGKSEQLEWGEQMEL